MQNSINQVSNLNGISDKLDKSTQTTSGDFSKVLEESLSTVNQNQVEADKAMADIATGEVKNLHQAALAIGKAEINMKLMLEIRNKALSAYKELGRTQI